MRAMRRWISSVEVRGREVCVAAPEFEPRWGPSRERREEAELGRPRPAEKG